MSESAPSILGAIEEEFQDDLQTERFSQYLFLTWSVDADYLRGFAADDEVVICGPDSVGETVEGLDQPNLSWEYLDSHAKCYLMWGEDRLRCWVGSFNLTPSALRDTLEWAVVQEAPLDTSLSLEELQDGTCDPAAVTTDSLLQQVLALVMGVLTASEPTLATDYRNTAREAGPIALTNGATPGPNGLHAAVETALDRADGAVSLTYYTPFVNQSGVEFLAEAVPEQIPPDERHIQIRTCRITEVDSQSTYLSQEELDALDHTYGSVDLQARASGTAGETLPGNETLRSGFAHFKLLLLSYTDHQGEDHTELLFTSANLTANAWRPGATQLEFGLWVRDPTVAAPLAEFFGTQLSRCYSRPNQTDFDTVERLESMTDLLTESSILDRLTDRLRVEKRGIVVDWASTEPTLSTFEATIFLREVAGTDTRHEPTTLVREGTEFVSDFDPGELDPGWVIDRIQLAVTTRCRPIEYTLSDRGLDELVTPGSIDETRQAVTAELETREITAAEIVVNDEHIIRGAAGEWPSVPEIDTLRIRQEFDGEPRVFRPTVVAPAQPHLPDAPIAASSASAIETDRFGGLCQITITPVEGIQLDYDMLVFTSEETGAIDWLGYAATDQGLTYFVDSSVAGETVTATLKEPYAAYYDEAPRQVTVECPPEISSTATQLRTLHRDPTYQFSHHPRLSEAGTDTDTAEAYITPGVPVGITPPPEIAALNEQDAIQLGADWNRRGGTYAPPTRMSLEETITPVSAHSRIVYRGSLTTELAGHAVTFHTPPNEFQVNQQVFASGATPDSRAVSAIDLDALSADAHANWLAFEADEILRPSVVLGPDRSIEMRVTVGDDRYDTSQRYPVYSGEQLFLIPLFGRHLDVGDTTRLLLQCSIANGPATYGSAALSTELSYDRQSNGLQQLITDSTGKRRQAVPIADQPGTKLPSLDRYRDFIHGNDLESYLEANPAFRVDERTATTLVIEALDTTVLHLGPYPTG
ncbi:phospholipase D family protein [Haloglomus halophilum]|uniref:phospholipase D family protein n=1 Tax=Haloglomus halophilum TaxID=2962672 RepID=UPI0020C9B9DF|nr:phospholipase D family protein [Haloglomus halophilum]